MEQLLAKIDDLETKMSFQEITLEELNQEVIKLNDLVARQQHQIMLMVSRLQAIEPSNMASQADETPPPHY
ncbi:MULTISPECIES: SlyX family protein [Pseudomonadati]|jgi:SlyX protein|uniref:Protein SlyX homolog n=3 Tax=Shewanella TaxID=22 RepID=A0A9X2WNV6_9GAMM|nr:MULTISPECIES: SlyX family protein [Shewanella]MCL1117587.1 SlyX family protein [Shewanella aestuarii]MCT7942705.1 SlyX family protein [Shewanella holmiensis]MCW3173165.1 SlyX family protein [Shewanella subflava]MDP5146871.1 SlyX family protein [Shewanella sp. ULN5]GGN75246.1 protein SlyX [Shewanella aestuarii]